MSSKPVTIEEAPTKRICPSDISVSLRKVSRQIVGTRNGKIPSSTSIRANASISDCGIGRCLLAWLACCLEILEEVGVRIENHEIALVPQTAPVSIQAAIEGVELRVLTERAGVRCRSLRVAFTLVVLRVSISLGKDDLSLPICFGTNFFRFARAGGTQFVGYPFTFRLHALVHRLADFLRQVDALQAHVQYLNTNGTGVLVRLGAQYLHDLVALTRHHVMHGAFAELGAQVIVDRLREPRLGAHLIASHADVILLDVDDAPLDEGVDQYVLLLRSDEALRLTGIQGPDANVEIAYVLYQRNFEVQPRLLNHSNHFAELEHDSVLVLRDRKQRQRHHYQYPNRKHEKGAETSH